jgi:large subunit ribosomal protein L1
MEKEQLEKLGAFIDANKGKRKFNQSVDLSINFSGIDFSKQDNRLNLEVRLPNGRGKESKVMIFSDDKNINSKAEQFGAKIVPGSEIATISNDKARQNELLGYELVAQPSLMPTIAKQLGQFLGPRNRMPRPMIGDVGAVIGGMGKSIYIRSKGKYLPTVHCVVGTEKMPLNEIAANVDEVIANVAKKVGRQNIKSVYVKLTMSEPLKLI